jgi:succinate dehydrogenase / fumarate reductase, cytochrome b subunit
MNDPMSARAIGFGDTRAAKFWSATIGKKIVMAITGVALIGFVVGHLVGNLQVFLGAEAFNAYAAFLRKSPALLMAVRIGLLAIAVLHIWASIQLALLNKLEARPVGYVKKKNVGSTYASRTMYWSGPILAAFIVYHLMHFTWGVGGTRFVEGEAYENLIAGFQVPVISIFYVVAMGLLMLHLYHGAWSMFQTLGVNHPRYTPLLKRFAQVLSILLFVGFVSIPLAVMFGFLK